MLEMDYSHTLGFLAWVVLTVPVLIPVSLFGVGFFAPVGNADVDEDVLARETWEF